MRCLQACTFKYLTLFTFICQILIPWGSSNYQSRTIERIDQDMTNDSLMAAMRTNLNVKNTNIANTVNVALIFVKMYLQAANTNTFRIVFFHRIFARSRIFLLIFVIPNTLKTL